MHSRRQWLKNSVGLGGLLLTPSIGLSAKEIELYRPRPLENSIRLSSNENPYGPSKKVQEAINQAFDHACRYPSAYSSKLAEKLAKKHGVSPESIVITGGSTEGLKAAGLTYAYNGGEIIACQPTFLAMMTYAKQWDAEINWVPVNQNKGYDLQEIEKRVSSKTKMIFLCNPNNPTGTLLPAQELQDFCQSLSKKTIVFSDEAYYDYIEEENYPSMDALVRQGENVIVSKTFSKVYGIAGLRIGYLIAKPSIATELKKNIMAMTNVLAIAAADASLTDTDFYEFSLAQNKKAKTKIYEVLDYLNLYYVPSSTNFVFFHSQRQIEQLQAQMLQEGVVVGRPFPPFLDWCRISTGTQEEVDVFVKAMLKIYNA